MIFKGQIGEDASILERGLVLTEQEPSLPSHPFFPPVVPTLQHTSPIPGDKLAPCLVRKERPESGMLLSSTCLQPSCQTL